MPKGMPCACGDKYGSETKAFWKQSNFDSWVADKSPGPKETHPGTIYLCRNELAHDRTPPMTYFLNMCNAGWHWPYKWEAEPASKQGAWPLYYPETPDYLVKGADMFCDGFKTMVDMYEQTRGPVEWGTEEQELNCHMCFFNDLGTLIAKNQLSGIKDLSDDGRYRRFDYNFKRACKLYRERWGCAPGEIIEVPPLDEVLNSTAWCS